MLGGIGAALVVIVIPLVFRVADLEPDSERALPLAVAALRFHPAFVRRGGRRDAVSRLRLSGAGEGHRPFRDHSSHGRSVRPGAFAESEFRLAGALQHHPVGRRAGLRVSPQRRSVAAHRPALRLELDPAPSGRQSQRVYNGCDRVLDALEESWERSGALEWRRLWPGRRFAHHRGRHRLVLLPRESSHPAPGSVPDRRNHDSYASSDPLHFAVRRLLCCWPAVAGERSRQPSSPKTTASRFCVDCCPNTPP